MFKFIAYGFLKNILIINLNIVYTYNIFNYII